MRFKKRGQVALFAIPFIGENPNQSMNGGIVMLKKIMKWIAKGIMEILTV